MNKDRVKTFADKIYGDMAGAKPAAIVEGDDGAAPKVRAATDGEAEVVHQWLLAHGAVERARDGRDVLFALPR